MKSTSRIIAFLLCICMILEMLPGMALLAHAETDEEMTILQDTEEETVPETTHADQGLLDAAVGSAEERYLEPKPTKGEIYFEISFLKQNNKPNVLANGTQTFDILRWKEFSIVPIFQGTDADGKAIILRNPGGYWQSSDDTVLCETKANRFYSIKEGTVPVELTFYYTSDDGETFVGKASFNVKALNLYGDKEALRCAALSQLVYDTNLNNYQGKTIEEALTPTLSSKPAMHDGDKQILAPKYQTDITPTIRDFVIAAAGDWTIEEQEVDKAYVAGVFRKGKKEGNGPVIIAYRGTNLLQLEDVASDVNLGLGLIEKDQFPKAVATAIEYPGAILTGHSLGGGLANYVSVLLRQRAYTFNAPSTMITAVSNFAAGEMFFPRFYTGLNDGLRMDYVNINDGIGKVGIGDSQQNLLTGSGNQIISGNLDRTIFLTPSSYNAPTIPTNHGISRMLFYSPDTMSIGFTATWSSTNPPISGRSWTDVHWSGNGYYFGSTGSDAIEVLGKTDITEYIFAGSGNDTIDIHSPAVHLSSASYYTGTLDPMNDYIVGGEGNDTITDHTGTSGKYYWFTGHGRDVIYDHGGQDALYITGVSELDKKIDGDTITITDNAQTEIVELHVLEGTGAFIVYRNDKPYWAIDRETKKVITFTGHCPVEVHILKDGEIVEVIPDGVTVSGSGEYGNYSAYPVGNEYAKSVSLYDDSYSLRFVGVGEGTMTYDVSYSDGTDKAPEKWHLSNIPVHVGAIYCPSTEYGSTILLGDLDGDGVFEYEPHYVKTTKLTLPKDQTLSFGKTMQLIPEIEPAAATPEFVWTSSSPETVTVDEQGQIVAVGFGTATITVMANDGSDIIASCEVTVSNENLNISDVIVEGIQARYDYTGEPIVPEFTLSFRDITLVENIHYRIEYSDEFMPGMTGLTVTGIGALQGEMTIPYEIYADQPDTVEKMVNFIYAECRKAGISGEYDTALWLHDWLINHANYDYDYNEYDADGVLLKGTGVCQSYSLAYELLLNKAGIENQVISAPEMNHAWNIVKLDGVWCHIDCTWDDPGTGGAENHSYFGMNDALMSRDHEWNRSAYPSATSMQNYYPLRNNQGALLAYVEADVTRFLHEFAAKKSDTFNILYIGTDKEIDLKSIFEEWFADNNWKYGLRSYSLTYGGYSITISIEYTDPWDEPMRLEHPVKAPDFALSGPTGVYRLSDYSRNGMVLVFGREGCLNTRGLMDRLHGELGSLESGGVQVLVCLENAQSPRDLTEMVNNYPNFTYVYGNNRVLFDLAGAVGLGYSVTYPLVVMINSSGMITYYSQGYVRDINLLVSEAFAVATGNVLPKPAEDKLDVKVVGNIAEIENSPVQQQLLNLSQSSNGVLFMYDQSPYYYNSHLLIQSWEQNAELYQRLNFKLVVCYDECSENVLAQLKAENPHVIYLSDDGYIFWNMLFGTGFEGGSAYYLNNYLIAGNGEIVDHTNGSTMSLQKCATWIALQHQFTMFAPASLVAIEDEAFRGSSFGDFDLMNSRVRYIGSRAFADCKNLKLIRIPESVISISDDAFDGCNNLVILCKYGSAAYQFAEAHSIAYLMY